ncbi:hypothetical protein BC830DRAFT_737747 [Chytriomyces sp. MP71]|nr:hypothetical protein BC830DRAFT_737747 [Chytriomyces sp. MP71]
MRKEIKNWESGRIKAPTMSIFATTLTKAGLDHYLDNFTAFGIDSLQSLTLLTMQDYGVVGVSSMEDRKRL